MRIGIIANRKYRDWILDTFSEHDDYIAAAFYNLHCSNEVFFRDVPVFGISQINNSIDAILIAIDSPELFEEIQSELLNVYSGKLNFFIIRPLCMAKRSDFFAIKDYLKCVSVRKDCRYVLTKERSVWHISSDSNDVELTDIESFRKDIERWRSAFSGIGMMRFRGYEPLKEFDHLKKMIRMYRGVFPESEIRVRVGDNALLTVDICKWFSNQEVIVEYLDKHINAKDEIQPVFYGSDVPDMIPWNWEKREAFLETESERIKNYKNEIIRKEYEKNRILHNENLAIKKQENARNNRSAYIAMLTDCFAAGYSMPQYCVDNEICHPLIVGMDKEIMWHIYVQFVFAKKMIPDFALMGECNTPVQYCKDYLYADALEFITLSSVDYDKYDAVFILDKKTVSIEAPNNKVLYIDELIEDMRNYVYNIRPFKTFVSNNPGVKLLLMNHPSANNSWELNDVETIIFSRSIHDVLAKLKGGDSDCEYLPFSRLGYSREQTIKCLERPEEVVLPDGSTIYSDNEDEIINIRNGIRKTKGQESKKYDHCIFCIGICAMYGFGAPWDKTIESFLQQLINESNGNYKVVNAGMFLSNRTQDMFFNLNRLGVNSGDIVISMMPNLHKCEEFPFLDVSKIFDAPDKRTNAFSDIGHFTENGYRVLANEIYSFLHDHNFMGDIVEQQDRPASPISYGIIPERREFLPELAEYKLNLMNVCPKIGSIVANCNPFTCGHRYLIEYAASRVDRLFVFVVEEDKSYFSFTDRIKMVELGTEDIDNVTVVPSGKFIISATTFEEYFNKEDFTDVSIDPTYDLQIFASEIAPVLGVNVRFVGEEPFDRVTRQYNEKMKEILPKSKKPIEVYEIPRLKVYGETVNASMVRREIESGDIEKIKKFVPTTTFDYLSKIFNW